MPFDRMVRLVDDWVSTTPGVKVFAQIGDSSYMPKNFEFTKFLSRQEFDDCIERCTSVVAHAGTGTIIQALLENKPLLVYPRLSRLGETRNDHQVGTARFFAGTGQLLAALDDKEFLECLARLQEFHPHGRVGADASPELLERITAFLYMEDSS